MKSIYKSALAFMLVITMGNLVSSCGGGDDAPAPKQIDNNNSNSGSDDNNNGGGNTNTGDVKQLILGSWKCTHNSTDYTVITFNQDGTSKWVYRCEDDIDRWTLPYEITSSQLIFTEEGKKIQYTYSLSGNRLIFDSDEYLKIENYVDEDDPDNNSGGTQTTADTDYANRGAVAKQFRGSGSSSDPYIISDATELRKLADDVESGKTYRDEYFKMTADVIINRNVLNAKGDLNGSGASFEQWKPIGKGATPFCGTFDGNGHNISGVYINKEQRDSLGLFGYFAGTLMNLTINDSYINGNTRIGTIVGVACTVEFSKTYAPKIVKCMNYATGKSLNGSYLGGIVGYAKQCTIQQCANYGKVTGYLRVGGIVGYLGASTATDCANYGSIIGDRYIGGITGTSTRLKISTYKYSNLKNCYNNGTIEASSSVGGGIFGYQSTTNVSYGVISNIVNYGKVQIASEKTSIGALGGYVYNVSSVINGYFLETSYPMGFGSVRRGNPTNIQSMTSNQMKAQSFLDELNKNAKALGSSYGQWKFGKDGYPILEWINE